jgi:ribosome-binding factor A
MASQKHKRAQMLAHCNELGPDDGLDPRDFFQSNRKRDKTLHRSQQLFRQVAETLDLVLSGESHDELLQSLRVVSVAPALDATRLLVAVTSDLSPAEFDRAAIESRLAEHAGRLRCAVAAAITRRKTPHLSFVVLGDLPQSEAAQ